MNVRILSNSVSGKCCWDGSLALDLRRYWSFYFCTSESSSRIFSFKASTSCWCNSLARRALSSSSFLSYWSMDFVDTATELYLLVCWADLSTTEFPLASMLTEAFGLTSVSLRISSSKVRLRFLSLSTSLCCLLTKSSWSSSSRDTGGGSTNISGNFSPLGAQSSAKYLISLAYLLRALTFFLYSSITFSLLSIV